MSAAVVVLPVVWAYAERVSAGHGENPNLGRKGPHSLRLVQAGAVEEPPTPAPAEVVVAEAAKKPKRSLAFYRKYTEAMLRRYESMSMEAGRVPSLLGRELFRGHVTSHTIHSFEDVVIYVHDVEKCLAKLDKGQQHLVRRIALQGYTQGETSAMLGINLRTVIRRYYDALDQLTAMFLRKGLLQPLGPCRPEASELVEGEQEPGDDYESRSSRVAEG
jgi:hypothetical protein